MEIIKEAKFISSSPDLNGCPPPKLPEFAFIGRSNVGKSSLINMITNFKGLAKISQTPGKTKHIAHFLINKNWYLVDLPGYGYAKVSKEQRKEFQSSILNYISKRETLYCLYVLIDSRVPPQPLDLRFITWLGENSVPFAIVFTKIDKLSKNECVQNTDAFLKEISEMWETLPPVFQTSSETKTGKSELINHITNALNGKV